MLGHHLGVTWRVLRRRPLHAALSIAVLTLGLTCFLAAGLFARYLDGFDRAFPSADRIYVLHQSFDAPANGLKTSLTPQSAFPVADQLRLDVPELEAVARTSLIISRVNAEGAEAQSLPVLYAESDWTRIFGLDVVAGELAGALARPATAVLTSETAIKLFGTTAAVGRNLTVEIPPRRVDVTVAAIANVPGPSHLSDSQFTRGVGIFCSWDVYEPGIPAFTRGNWAFPSVTTYLLLPKDESLTASRLDDRLRALAERPLPDPKAKIGFAARPVSESVKNRIAMWIQGFGLGGLPLDITTILVGLGSLILGIACLNFINLATAGSAGRGREIGVRKSLGATAQAIIAQDLLRTAALAAISAALACGIIYLTVLPFGDPLRAIVAMPWWMPSFWIEIGVLLIGVTAAAGLYPALVLARVNPASALRIGKSPSGPPLLRTVLVGLQVASAAFLCFAVTVAYMQATALRETAVERFSDQYVVLGAALRATSGRPFDVVAAELARGPGIRGVAGMSASPWQALGSLAAVRRTPDPDGAQVPINNRYVTSDYFALVETPLLAGRWFSRDRADDTAPSSREDLQRRTSPPPVVIDRQAVADLGWPNPADAVGKLLYPGNLQQPMEIIGVVENQPFALRSRESNAYIYALAPQQTFVTLVRIDSSQARAALEHIDDVWRRLAPNAPITRTFLDEAFERAYSAFNTLSRVAAGIASFAIAIAAVGLLGMAGFVTARRTREIGLRKTQGASSHSILLLLLWDFSKPVVVANLAIWPIAYIAARSYLALFVERMSLTPLPFAATLIATLLLAWAVVGAYVVAAARLNPAVALRHE
ncbi:MAG TPA: ABC transporter permease [Gammaproteobacteria bacterium]|nr:ABC transporter permease [Gammaproteobacteria bacterium]